MGTVVRPSGDRRTGRPPPLSSILHPPPLPLAAAYLDALARFADFDGRASRAQFWGFWLVHAGMVGVLGAASVVVGMRADLAWVVGSAVMALYLVLTVFPALSLAARRLHDVGRSSLWVSVALVPVLGLLVVYWCLQPGDPAPNAWGQPPGPDGA